MQTFIQVSPAFAIIIIFFCLLALYLVFKWRPVLAAPSSKLPAARRVEEKIHASLKLSANIKRGSISLVAILVALLVLPSLWMKSFDPYKALGVESGAPLPVVNKAYRKLSLQHHPDRGGDPVLFASIHRAYASLTKEDERKNFELYGNPEGKMEEQFGSMKDVSKSARSVLVLSYVAGLLFSVLVGVMYVQRPRSMDEVEESKLPAHLIPIRRACKAIDVVAPLPGLPFGVPQRPLPTEKDNGQEKKKQREIDENIPKSDAASLAALIPKLPGAARGTAGLSEWRDFYEPRFEAVKPFVVFQGNAAGGVKDLWDSPSPPLEDLEKFYDAWRAAVPTVVTPEYPKRFKEELLKLQSKEDVDKITGDHSKWTPIRWQFRMLDDDNQTRKAWEIARLHQLIAVARTTDPRLAALKKSN